MYYKGAPTGSLGAFGGGVSAQSSKRLVMGQSK